MNKSSSYVNYESCACNVCGGDRLVVNVHVIITLLLCGMGTKAQINTLEMKWQVEQSAIDHMTPVCKCHDITRYHFLLLILQYLEADRPLHACNIDLG